jgi:FHS family glucose/mannose:H+ symporter-like MFS transporter
MTDQGATAASSKNQRALSNVVLGAGFGLTGAGTVMLGVLLPILSAKWGMRDDAAGFLLFLQFIGASLGAIFTGARRIRSIAIGYALLFVSAGALTFAGMHVSFVLFFFFGLGLGMVMTATSLLFSDRYDDDRAAQLEHLNFVWAIGATAAPILLLPLIRRSSLSPVFFAFQGFSLLIFVWVILGERQWKTCVQLARDTLPAGEAALRGALLPLVALAMCAVGVEASLSGWLTTYSHRADSLGKGGAAFSVSLFWLGIMLSRLAFSTRLLTVVGRRRLLRILLWAIAVSLMLLTAASHPRSIRFAAAMAGLCIGPLYPLLLSFILQRCSKGWVFAVAGVGSAVLPWLTGLFSAHFGSLRYGLIAPCGAAALMVALFAVGVRSE